MFNVLSDLVLSFEARQVALHSSLLQSTRQAVRHKLRRIHKNVLPAVRSSDDRNKKLALWFFYSPKFIRRLAEMRCIYVAGREGALFQTLYAPQSNYPGSKSEKRWREKCG